MQHSSRLSPVIRIFMFRGQPVEVCRACGGTYDEAAGALVDTMLPQNVATKQGINHAILANGAEDTARRPSAVAAGDVGGMGHGVRGEGTGQ